MELNHQVAVVTGAAQGIGKAIAGKLAEAGAKTYILDYNLGAAKQTETEFRAAGLSCTAVRCDVSDIPAAQAVIADRRTWPAAPPWSPWSGRLPGSWALWSCW